MFFFLLYKIGEMIALAMPVRLSYRLAALISDIKYFFSFYERREMVENLKQVLPGADIKILRRHSKKIFANFSKYLVDFFRFKKLDSKYIEERVEIIHKDYIDAALKRGKGAIILSAHLGNWELGGAVMGILGYPINVLALDHKNKLVNDFFINQRRIKNENIISIKFAVRKCFKALAGNELIAIVADKDFTNIGEVVSFFGKETLLPKGPAALSLKTGAVIIPGYLIRAKNEYFKLIFEKPIEYTPSGDFDRDVRALTVQCTKRLENCIRTYPTQWYCFRRFWLDHKKDGK